MKKIAMVIFGLIIIGIMYVIMFGIPLWALLHLTIGVHRLNLSLSDVLQVLAIILFVKIIPSPKTFSQILSDITEEYRPK